MITRTLARVLAFFIMSREPSLHRDQLDNVQPRIGTNTFVTLGDYLNHLLSLRPSKSYRLGLGLVNNPHS